MCKFVNTLSGKNAQSSALGASATARFRPHPLYALRAFFPASALSPFEGGAGGGLILRKTLQRYIISAPFVAHSAQSRAVYGSPTAKTVPLSRRMPS